jgi:hypothetical protein
MDPVAFARRLSNFPSTLETSTRQRIARGLEQLRLALDLPSRKELIELSTRLEALDQRIASLAAGRAEGRAVATLEAGEPEAQLDAAPEPIAALELETETTDPVIAVSSSVTLPDGATNGARAQHKKKPRNNRR